MKISLSRSLRALLGNRRRSPGKARMAGAILAGGLMFSGAAAPAPAVELVENGGFEQNDGLNGDNAGYGWQNDDGIPVFDVYSHSTQVYYEGPAPAGAADWYFHSVGVSNTNGVYQLLDLTQAATPVQIDAGTVRFDMTAWLAGYTAQNDHPRVELQLLDGGGAPLSDPLVFDGSEFGPGSGFVTTVTGEPIDSFTNPIAAWKQYQAVSGVFIGARTARLAIYQDSITGNGNDNYTDLVSLDVADAGVPQFLSLRVNTTTGATSMVNPTAGDVEINFYQILSAGNSLSAGGWNSLDDQNLDLIGPNPGESWTEGGGSDSSELVEAFLLGSSSLASGSTTSLGPAYDSSVDAQDLRFLYASPRGTLIPGIVEYFEGISGDFDGNGVYECQDIDALVAAAAAGTNNPAFDLTGDGLVDLSDVDAWRAEAGAAQLASGNPYLPGDANLNGDVDVSDFNTWNGNKFTNVAAWCRGDFNASGGVDVSDFNIWNGNKFQSANGVVSSVPEPGCLVLVLAAGFGLLWSRRPRP